MEVEIFTLADYATNPGNGKLTIVGTFDTITTDEVPTYQHCHLVLKVRIANAHAGEHRLGFKFMNAAGEEFMPLSEYQFDLEENPIADYNAIPLVINLSPLKLEKFGRYAVELHHNGEFHSGLKFSLVSSMTVAPEAVPAHA